jgi:hypothetical protein
MRNWTIALCLVVLFVALALLAYPLDAMALDIGQVRI